jgi:hypothetical protein
LSRARAASWAREPRIAGTPSRSMTSAMKAPSREREISARISCTPG